MFFKLSDYFLNREKPVVTTRGFTLIETIAAIAIVAIGLFGIMGLVGVIIKGNAHSRRVTAATTLAQDKLEEISRIGFDNYSTTDFGTYTAKVDNFGTGTGYNIDFYWEAEVQDDTPGANTKTINVGVFWDPPGSSSTHKVEIQTILAQ